MSTNDVVNHILKLKNKNSCGFDSISPKILQLSTPYIAETLTYLYNICLDKSYFPVAFKLAKMIPPHKKGNMDDVNNFRPISLLSAISKPLEGQIHVHMETFVEKNKLLYINQSGFRKNHSCKMVRKPRGPRKNLGASGIRTRDLPLSKRTPYH